MTLLLAALALWLIPPLSPGRRSTRCGARPTARSAARIRTAPAGRSSRRKLDYLLYGSYPEDAALAGRSSEAIGAALIVWLLWPGAPRRGFGSALFFVVYPVVGFRSAVGAPALGLPYVDTLLWGGVFVSLLTALVGIVVSLPLGVLLALGRRSRLPLVRAASVVFIEVVRGVPFITVLFMANNMLPLFLPPGVEPDRFLRPLVGIALFSAAYMAEEVRGGLQTLPRGQYEGAMALGLDYWRMMGLVVLPQALALVIPGIVNNFIGLFKDTTLVVDRRRQRFPRSDRSRHERPGLGGADDLFDRLRLRRAVLFRVLLRDVALFGGDGAAACGGAAAIGRGRRV